MRDAVEIQMLQPWTWQVSGQVAESEGDAAQALTHAAAGYQPLVIRGLASHWPLVQSGGPQNAAQYLGQFDQGAFAKTMLGPPAIAGRFFYADDMKGYNFAVDKIAFAAIFAQLLAIAGDENAPAIYAGSNPVDEFLPGFEAANHLPFDIPSSAPRIWIGNATHVAPHFDVSDNIAVVALGRRRFTLFPPEQTPNLYVGPLDITIAGQPVSMVDIRSPDLTRYPLYAAAMEHAVQVDLEPGDAIFIPTLWWHCVEALDPVNILVNYWYNAPVHSSPFAALIHAMLAVRDLPVAERAGWKTWFENFVFSEDAASAAAHLPPHAQGVSGPPSQERAQAVTAYVMRALN